MRLHESSYRCLADTFPTEVASLNQAGIGSYT